MRVIKFGGTSVQDAAAVKRLIEIVKGKLEYKPIIVVSALSKVTDSLYKISTLAKNGDHTEANIIIKELQDRHLIMCEELFGNNENLFTKASDYIGEICSYLHELVKVAGILRELSNQSMARVISIGEVLSSYIICAALNNNGVKTKLIDAKQIIITDNNYLKGTPIHDEIISRSLHLINESFNETEDGKKIEAIITQGFISSTIDNTTTVLGRGGSDYSASLIGMAINADMIEIWTDVSGIHTTNPNKVSNCKSIDVLSFEEAAELARFGAKILHPLTILPAIEKNIPVYVFNSMDSNAKGTKIISSTGINYGIKSIAYKENICFLNLNSTESTDNPNFLYKVFEAFKALKIQVDLLNISDNKVTLTTDEKKMVKNLSEYLSGIAKIEEISEKSQISVIGKGISEDKNLTNRIFNCLTNYKLDMTLQGASPINISFVVDNKDLNSVIQILHQEFFEE